MRRRWSMRIMILQGLRRPCVSCACAKALHRFTEIQCENAKTQRPFPFPYRVRVMQNFLTLLMPCLQRSRLLAMCLRDRNAWYVHFVTLDDDGDIVTRYYILWALCTKSVNRVGIWRIINYEVGNSTWCYNLKTYVSIPPGTDFLRRFQNFPLTQSATSRKQTCQCAIFAFIKQSEMGKQYCYEYPSVKIRWN